MDDIRPVRTAKVTKASCTVFLLVLAAGILLVSKFLRLVFPAPAVPLFEPADGLRAFSTAEAAVEAGLRPSLPTQTFGASLYAVAEYPQGSPTFPAGTTNALYAKDGARTFEVLALPVGADDSRAQKLAVGTRGPDVAVHGATGRTYVSFRPSPTCVDPTPERPIRLCQLGARLVFGTETETVIVAVDGNALTEGELIEIARSILTQTKTPE